MWKSALALIGLILLGLGGWMQTTKPDYNHLREVLHLQGHSAAAREPEPVPGWLIAVCFFGGVVTLAVGIYSER